MKSLFLLFMMALAPLESVPAPSESHLQIDYQVQCDAADRSSFPGIVAEIRVGTRKLRTYLLKYQTRQVVSLGAPTTAQLDAISIRYLPNRACKLVSVRSQPVIPQGDALAIEHSPYLVLRADQQSHAERDIPFHLAWSRVPRDDGFSILYTIYFSNETDYGMFATTKAKSQALWGRRTDIEWIYQVQFDRSGRVVRRTYQSGVMLGMGHATRTFRGKFLPGTSHPILYDIARHNVFSDHPYPGQSIRMAGVHPTPLTEIVSPESREDWMWRNPWSFDLSDRELRRTGRLSFPSEDYLYVRLTGDLQDGQLVIQGSDMTMDRITLSSFGEDLWHRSDYTAFRIRSFPEADRKPAGQSIDFTPTTDNAQVEERRFLRLIPDPEKGFVARDITPLFRCTAERCDY